jgi:hypothetical protein
MDGSTYAMATRTTWCTNRNTDLAGGTLKIYDGPMPATPDTAISGSNHLLATLILPNTAGNVGTVLNDTLTLAAITAVLVALGGSANWGRFATSGGTAVADGPVGNQTVTLTAGAALNATSLTVAALAQPLYAGMDLWFSDGGVLKKASVTVDAIATATSVTVSNLAAAISSGSASVQAITIDAPKLVQNASLSVTAATLQAPGSN